MGAFVALLGEMDAQGSLAAVDHLESVMASKAAVVSASKGR